MNAAELLGECSVGASGKSLFHEELVCTVGERFKIFGEVGDGCREDGDGLPAGRRVHLLRTGWYATRRNLLHAKSKAPHAFRMT